MDHIDVFFVAPSDLATSMGHIGNMGHPDVQQTIDGAIEKIVAGRPHGRHAGRGGNVEHYTSIGVRCIMTGILPWIQAGAKNYMSKARAAAK